MFDELVQSMSGGAPIGGGMNALVAPAPIDQRIIEPGNVGQGDFSPSSGADFSGGGNLLQDFTNSANNFYEQNGLPYRAPEPHDDGGGSGSGGSSSGGSGDHGGGGDTGGGGSDKGDNPFEKSSDKTVGGFIKKQMMQKWKMFERGSTAIAISLGAFVTRAFPESITGVTGKYIAKNVVSAAGNGLLKLLKLLTGK